MSSNFEDFRKGDEAEDTRIGDFKVYGGAPADREKLQEEDPELLNDLDAELQSIIQQHKN